MGIFKRITGLILGASIIVGAAAFGACAPREPEREDMSETLTMLKAVDEYVVNRNGEGEAVYLRGANVGGMMVLEQWMTGFTKSSGEDGITCIDHKTTSLEFVNRFGKDKAKQLWIEYQNRWFSEQDFQNCADMGMTVLRLPFTYMNVDFDAVVDLADAGKSYDFTALDNFVATAASYGIYTILDLHGAYGSQNGQDHSGEVLPTGGIDFYSNETKLTLTAKLWGAVAEHFKNNPYVAGYDLINEPAEHLSSGTDVTSERHWSAMDRFYKAIREKGDNHIVIIESCWDGRNLPQPSSYGWQNVMYSFHHYTGETKNCEAHTDSFINKLNEIESQEFGVPLYMGEFTCYENAKSWDATLSLLNTRGWHWTSWTYKLNATYRSAWGIYNVSYGTNGSSFGEEAKQYRVNAHKDTYEQIIEKWDRLKSEANKCIPYRFDTGETLVEIITKHCGNGMEEGVSKYAVADGAYTVRLDELSAFTFAEGMKKGNYTAILAKTGSSAKINVVNGKGGAVQLSSARGVWGAYVHQGDSFVGVVGDEQAAAAKQFEFRCDEGGNVAIFSRGTGAYLIFDEATSYILAECDSFYEASFVTLEV